MLEPQLTSSVPTSSALSTRKYCIRYENNNSKRWDGKRILLDGEWLESLYPGEDLMPGKVVRLPWKKKGGVSYWNAVVGDENAVRDSSATKTGMTKAKGTKRKTTDTKKQKESNGKKEK